MFGWFCIFYITLNLYWYLKIWECVENKIDFRSSIHTFIVVVLEGCLTFWLTKNYFGRKLIGLRWWNGEEEKGEGWVFESRHPLTTLNPVDKYIFWTVLYCSSAFWLIMFVLKGKHVWIFWSEHSIFRLFIYIGNISLPNNHWLSP